MTKQSREVRIGPISLFTLIAVLCLSALAVLSISTANASYNMARLQGASMEQQYEAESGAQRFVALVDEKLAQTPSTAALAASLETIEQEVVECSDGRLAVEAALVGSELDAAFTCENGRTLEITLLIQDNGAYSIRSWHMTAIENSEQAEQLWSGL